MEMSEKHYNESKYKFVRIVKTFQVETLILLAIHERHDIAAILYECVKFPN